MVDDDYNGWRRLVLPIAHTDDLVKLALISASLSYVSPSITDQLISPYSAYQRVLYGLRQRQDLPAEDLVGKQCILLTLLILLAMMIVNGSSDFRGIFNLLEASLKAVQYEHNLYSGELGSFISTQIPKYYFFDVGAKLSIDYL